MQHKQENRFHYEEIIENEGFWLNSPVIQSIENEKNRLDFSRIKLSPVYFHQNFFKTA